MFSIVGTSSRCYIYLTLASVVLLKGFAADDTVDSRLLQGDETNEIKTFTKKISKDVAMNFFDDPDNTLSLKLTIDFRTGAGGSDRDEARKRKVIHGVLALSSGAILIPMGTTAAAWKGSTPLVQNEKFYLYHRLLQTLGLIVGLMSGFYALVKIYPGSSDIVNQMPIHGRFGLIVMVTLVLQPLLGIIFRILPPGKLTKLGLLLHKITGRMATVQGIAQCLLGAYVAHRQHRDEPAFDYMVGFSISAGIVFVVAFISGLVWSNREQKKCEQRKDDLVEEGNNGFAPGFVRV